MKTFGSTHKKFKYTFGLETNKGVEEITLTPNVSAKVVLLLQSIDEETFGQQFGYITNNLFGKHKDKIINTLSLLEVMELITDIVSTPMETDNTPSNN
jgi:hypothetical protein